MKKLISIIFMLVILSSQLYAQVQRFPKPDFESGYEQPVPDQPLPRAAAWNTIDIAVLFLTLSLVSWLVIKKRSRKGIFSVMLFSLLYFGFFRKGCICPVGSVQNMVLSIFDPGYIIPVVVIAFFSLPLIFALFYGRTFCAGVCPLGALQDVIGLKPIKLPAWLERTLGILPIAYLGFAILFAATGAGFIVCRFDPFVGIFRRGMNAGMFVWSMSVLLIGVFVARPYCRFLCPYGVLLGWMSRLSRRHVTITPAECINCHLCADSCPYGAINGPAPDKYPGEYRTEKWKFTTLVLAIPIAMLIGAWSLSQMSVILSRSHPVVRTAEQIRLEDTGRVDYTTDASDAFRGTGEPVASLYARAAAIQKQFKTGTRILGAFLALMIMLRIINLYMWRRRDGYETDKGNCLSCGRCIATCPIEHERLAELKGEPIVERAG